MKLQKSDAYINYALTFSKKECSLRNFFASWLPDEIIDCHTHAGQIDHFERVDDALYSRPLFSFPGFNLDDSIRMTQLFHPKKNVRMLRFAFPFFGVNHRKNNRYLFEKCPRKDRIALCGIPTDIDYTIKELGNARTSALKMYYFFFNPPTDQLYKIFPRPVLDEAQLKRIPIILHLPKTLPHTINQLLQMLKDFPNLKIVLAHLGIYTEKESLLEECFGILSKYRNIFLDTSMVFSTSALSLSLKYFGINRILYGSDEPLNYLRVKMYTHPKLGFRFISDYPYHWILQDDFERFGQIAIGAPHAHWQTLMAIRIALENTYGKDCTIEKEKIFFLNSMKLFGF